MSTMRRTGTAILIAVVCVGLTCAVAEAQTFNNPNYIYTQVWSADDAGFGYGRWPVYSSSSYGDILVWRTSSNTVMKADVGAGMALSNIAVVTTNAYMPSISPDGRYIVYSSVSDTATITTASGDVTAQKMYRYDRSTGTTETVFDLSTLDPANVATAVNNRPGSQASWGMYASAGPDNTTLYLGMRGNPTTSKFDLMKYDMVANTLTNLSNSPDVGDFQPQVFGTDTTSVLMWTEGISTNTPRNVTIYDTATGTQETVVQGDTTVTGVAPWPAGYTNASWGKDMDSVLVCFDTMADGGMAYGDLYLYENDGSGWSFSADLTGDAWDTDDGYIYSGTSLSDGSFFFGVLGNTLGADGIWFAEAIRTEVWVDASGNDSNPGTELEPFATIQHGISVVADGGTVNVAAGVYVERLLINKPVTLVGAQVGVDPTVMGARTSPAAESIIDISGLALANPNIAIEVASGISDVTIKGFTVIGSPVFHYADEAVLLCWADSVVIQNNIIDGYFGVLYKGGTGLTVDGNRMVINKQGVTVQPNAAYDVVVSGNSVALGSAPEADATAMYATATTGLEVTGNTATGFVGGRAIAGSSLTDVLVSGNTFTGNNDGISFWGTTTFVTISQNDLSGSARYGVTIKGQDISITGNTITNCGDASISVDRHVIDTERVVIQDNDLSGSVNLGLKVSGLVTETVNASPNWWGDTDPSDNVSGAVTYYPCYADASMTTLYSPIKNVTQGIYYGTIREAVDAANSGETITVAAGTYTEQVTLTPGKDLVLIGAGRDVVTWIAPSGGKCLVGSMSGYAGAMSYEVTGFTFNCRSDAATTWGCGVMIYEARNGPLTLSIHGNRFIEDRASGDDGHWATSIFACHNRFAARDGLGNAPVRIYDNIDETWGGMTMSNTRAYDVYENTFDGCSNALYNGHGCPDSDPSLTFGDHRIYGNTFKNASDALHPGSLTPAIDWQYYGAGVGTHLASVIENNVFEDNDTAVRFVMDANMTYPSHAINGNSFVSNVTAIRVVGAYASTLNASGNWWGDLAPSDDVLGDVDYTPWLASGTDTSADPGFQGDFSTLYVDDDSPQTGAVGRIQEAIGLVSGSTVNVAAGTYDETLNIDGLSSLSIVGADPATTIVQSSTTIGWNVGGYGETRQTMVRVVDSTDVTLQNLTFDCDMIKGNGKFGITGYDSEVTVDNCVIKNMSVDDASGGYYELGSYFRAPGFTDAARAAVTVTNSAFIDTGRVGVVTHDYIHATITNNVFYKTFDDFGYAMEVGSQSTGVVSSNQIHGYDTPAASDGSESAGIYVENSFTGTVFGGSPHVNKPVLVENNDIYDCQYAMWIGNGYDGYAGDVDIAVTLNSNSFHDNVEGAVWIQDEDASDGSSVTVTGGNNVLSGNSDYGLRIFTAGDGNITVALSGEVIAGHAAGVLVEDSGVASTSVYSVAITNSSISGNSTFGVNNTTGSFTVNATDNWWGAADGPSDQGPGSGDAVSVGVNFAPYKISAPNVNVLQLNNPGAATVYLNPNDAELDRQIVIDMDALNLAQHVIGCQAVLNFSSTYFLAGSGEVDVAAGGGVWDQLIYSLWDSSGDLDVAVGVELTSPVGTKADGTVAMFTLTVDPSAPDGTTTMVFRADGDPEVESTFFSDLNALRVDPGSKLASQDIVIDGTAPVIGSFSAAPLCTKTMSTLTFAVSDGTAGVEQVDVIVDGGPVALDVTSPYSLDMSAYATGDYAVQIRVTDNAGNTTDSSVVTVSVDQAAPVIASVTATQDGDDALCPAISVQGTVTIMVEASDAGCADLMIPTVVLANGAESVTLTTSDVASPFSYDWIVGSTTTNGTWSVTVTASDALGNTSQDTTSALCVDKNQITGTVSFATESATSYTVVRDVVFKATDGGGVVETWTVPVSFVNGSGVATGSYVLTNVPAGTTGLSAKTDWALRQKTSVTFDGNNQAVAAFSLLGGDLNGSNSVNILDYGLLKLNWYTPNAVADINGDGGVQLLDYTIMKENWFERGDAD